MTPEQQQIAIAEACGWSPDDGWKRTWTHRNGPAGIAIPTEYLPDYLNDLNAMHEAEKVVILQTIDKTVSFRNHLLVACGASNYEISDSLIWHATAAQRAEAFLKTLNLWKQ